MKIYLIYHGAINEPSVRNVETLCLQAIRDGATEIVLCISSGGGDVNAGLGLYNFLRMLPVSIHTHNFGNCGSIAATLFMAGDKRTSSPVSNFMLHAATYIEGPRKGQIAENTALIAKPFETRSKIPQEKLDSYLQSGAESFIALDEALSYEITHSIEDIELPADGRVLTVRLEKD